MSSGGLSNVPRRTSTDPPDRAKMDLGSPRPKIAQTTCFEAIFLDVFYGCSFLEIGPGSYERRRVVPVSRGCVSWSVKV